MHSVHSIAPTLQQGPLEQQAAALQSTAVPLIPRETCTADGLLSLLSSCWTALASNLAYREGLQLWRQERMHDCPDDAQTTAC